MDYSKASDTVGHLTNLLEDSNVLDGPTVGLFNNNNSSATNKAKDTEYFQEVLRELSFLIHSFIPDIYIAPLQETYSEALSVHLRSKRNVLRSLQKEDTLFRGSKRSVRGSQFQVEGPITEK